MGTISFAHWFIVLLLGFLVIFPMAKILKRMGFSPWLSVLSILPFVGMIFMWFLAFARWPAVDPKIDTF